MHEYKLHLESEALDTRVKLRAIVTKNAADIVNDIEAGWRISLGPEDFTHIDVTETVRRRFRRVRTDV